MTRGRKGWEQVTGPGRNCAFGGHYQPIALHLIILILKLSERRTRLLLDLRHRSGSCSASIPAKEPLTRAYIGCLFLHRFKWTHEFFPFHPKFNTYYPEFIGTDFLRNPRCEMHAHEAHVYEAYVSETNEHCAVFIEAHLVLQPATSRAPCCLPQEPA